MILLGIRDLTIRELTELVHGELEVVVDKKIRDEFQKPPESHSPPPKPLQTPPLISPAIALPALLQPDKLPGFLDRQFSRCLLISLAVHLMQHRSQFRCQLLEILARKLGSDSKLPRQTTEMLLSAAFDGQLAEGERAALLSSAARILEKAELVLSLYWIRLTADFQRLETCAYIEANKISFNFLIEIEKANYEDRRLSKILGLYRNYFKKRAADKQEPTPYLYKEVFLAQQLDAQLQALEKLVLAAFSFERKAYLQNKQLAENEFLVGYSANTALALEGLRSVFEQISRLKEERTPVSLAGEKLLASALEGGSGGQSALARALTCFLDDFLRVGQAVAFQAAENQKALKANPKFKPRGSESWQALESLLASVPAKPQEELIKESAFSLAEVLPVLSALSFPALSATLAEVFSPAVEQSKKPKIPKGTRDYTPLQMSIKSRAIETIRAVYRRHGAEELDTPVFELKETLLGKYGEEGGKLIYDLEDQGGELLSLRYDLTVPFARYMGLNNLSRMKRFHIGKVYRRDQPNVNKGRFREFYQCDLDIAGKTDLMLAEAEVLRIVADILAAFDLKFKIKVCHRLLLEAMVECAQCDARKFKMICSAIDKLDKEPWPAVEQELVAEKGLTHEQAARLGALVQRRGPIEEMLKLAAEEKLFGANIKAQTALSEMARLAGYLQLFGVYQLVEFDFSLARGLDYYTGMIFEAVLVEGEGGLGSIAGGGRYDELIGMFSKEQIPAVGGSIGVERLFVILEERLRESSRSCATEFLVASIGKSGTLERKLQVVSELWAAGLSAEFLHDEFPRPDKQLKFALEKRIPYVVWVGEDEVKKGVVKVKNLYLKKEVVIEDKELKEVARMLSVEYGKDLVKGAVIFEE